MPFNREYCSIFLAFCQVLFHSPSQCTESSDVSAGVSDLRNAQIPILHRYRSLLFIINNIAYHSLALFILN
jgi:hypothetical protein